MKVADNTVVSLKTLFFEHLSDLYDKSEVGRFFELAAEQCLGMSTHDLIIDRLKRVSESEMLKMFAIVKGLKQEKPIQYLLGTAHFYGMQLAVNENVLIPRPETEELVDLVVKTFANETNDLKIMDIGTGSGCIALALKKAFPESTVYAIDISDKALQLAQSNAAQLQLNVHFSQADVLSDELESLGKLDVIVSNPPYVMFSEKAAMKKNVVDYEPHTALFVPDKYPLVFHERIAELAKQRLNKNGRLFFEINERWGEDLVNLLKKMGFKSIELKQDLSMKNRLIKCSV